MSTPPCDTKELLNRAVALFNAGRKEALAQVCRQLIDDSPKSADAWYMLGVSEWQSGRHEAAEAALSRALKYNDTNPAYYNALGIVLTESGNIAMAETMLRHALPYDPQSVDLLCNLGRVLMLQSRHQEAAFFLKAALRQQPGHAASLANMAVIHHAGRRLKSSADCYRHALASAPHRSDWWANLGAVLLGLGQNYSAERCYRRALSASPVHQDAMRGLAMTYCAMGNYEAAVRLLLDHVRYSPGDTEATVTLAIAAQHTGCWGEYDDIVKRMSDHTHAALQRDQVPAEQPLINIRRSDDVRLNLKVARAWSRTIAKRVRRSYAVFDHSTHNLGTDRPLVVGYLSADFRNHAVSHQAVSLFEYHDRSRFRICGFSVGTKSDDAYHRRIRASCDHFQDISEMDGGEAARTIYDQKVDILIDLMGHTQQNRLDICALRPAPIQISYLGFLGSSGADFIDYLVGDHVVTPDDQAAYYSEKLIRLPHCYQIISPISLPLKSYARQDVHLPEKAFVFCCFNQLYKIDLDLFHRWMVILHRAPGSVLWLYCSSPETAERLQTEAERSGISPHRLIFADKVPLDHHIARLQLADLALDTPAYNGGATTANALMAGVPLIATLGNHFVSRMSASHLKTLGLPELIVPDRQAYVEMAINIARSPSMLSAIKRKMKKLLPNSPLLKPKMFVRTLEKAYLTAWQRYCDGLPPAALDISPAFDTHPQQDGDHEC